jgi:aquaporin Z
MRIIDLFGEELTGTLLLVAIGFSIVIIDFGQGGAIVQLIPSAAWRRLITRRFTGLS